jgi:hypothetical protein
VEELGDPGGLQHRSYKVPSAAFVCWSKPIATILCSRVIEGNDEGEVGSRSETNASDSVATCLNVDRKESAGVDVEVDEAANVGEGGFDPDVTGGSPDFGEAGFGVGLN